MQRHESAARCFYRALFHWSAWSRGRHTAAYCHASHSHHHGDGRPGYHIGRSRCQWQTVRSPVLSQARHDSTSATIYASQLPNVRESGRRAAAKHIIGVAERLRTCPVQTSTELPSSELAPCKFALRERSDTHATIELAISGTVMEYLREKSGLILDKVIQMTGVQISIGEMASRPVAVATETGTGVNYVLTISGSYLNIAWARSYIISYKVCSPIRNSGYEIYAGSFKVGLTIPQRAAGLVVGPRGRGMVSIRKETRCYIYVNGDPNALDSAHVITLIGTPNAVSNAKNIIQGLVDEACTSAGVKPFECQETFRTEVDPSDPLLNGTAFRLAGPGFETVHSASRPADSVLLKVGFTFPKRATGFIIGPHGITLRRIKKRIGCHVEMLRVHNHTPADPDRIETAYLTGTAEVVEEAKVFIQELVHEHARRNDTSTFQCQETSRIALDAEAQLPESRSASKMAAIDTRSKKDPPIQSPPQSPEIIDCLRTAFRSMAHPVVLITASVPYPKEISLPPAAEARRRLEALRGMTVSSFNTVTLAPRPLVSLNIRLPSRTWSAIEANGLFQAHILTPNARGAAIAHMFTKPYEPPYLPFEILCTKGAKIDQKRGHSLNPVLYDGGVLRALQCRLIRDYCLQVGDHLIVVAEVEGITPAQEMPKGKEEVDALVGLTYSQGAYRAGGEVVEAAEMSNVQPIEAEAVVQEDNIDHDAEPEDWLISAQADQPTKPEAVHEINIGPAQDAITSIDEDVSFAYF